MSTRPKSTATMTNYLCVQKLHFLYFKPQLFTTFLFFNTLRPRQNQRHFADDIFKLIFLDEYCGIWFEFHWHLFPTTQLQQASIGSDNGLAPDRRQAIIWTNDNIIHWHTHTHTYIYIYASLSLNELRHNCFSMMKTHFPNSHWSPITDQSPTSVIPQGK